MACSKNSSASKKIMTTETRASAPVLTGPDSQIRRAAELDRALPGSTVPDIRNDTNLPGGCDRSLEGGVLAPTEGRRQRSTIDHGPVQCPARPSTAAIRRP